MTIKRTLINPSIRAGHWPRATLEGLILAALIVPPAWSAVTAPPTGPINGTVPFLKTAEPERSRLYVADQDGNTVGTTPENSIVNKEHTPSSFKASTTETLDIFPDDLDGDCDTTGGFRPACDVVVGATTNRVWKYNDIVLTATQLSSPFKTYFSGKSLKVKVTAPVTTTSHTGDPTVGTNPLSSDETLVYVPAVPGIYVGVHTGVTGPNNYYWEPLKSFPTTAGLGLKFTFYMGGNQSDYTFTTNRPSWTSVNSAGVVTFTAAPTSATKTVTITARQIAAPHTVQNYTFTVNKWFSHINKAAGASVGSKDVVAPALNALCVAGLGAGFKAAEYVDDLRGNGKSSTFRQVPGGIYQEWGVQQADSLGYSGALTYSAYQLQAGTGYTYTPAYIPNPSATLEGYPTVNRLIYNLGAGSRVSGYEPIMAADIDGWTPYYLYTELGDISTAAKPADGSPSKVSGTAYRKGTVATVPCVLPI